MGDWARASVLAMLFLAALAAVSFSKSYTVPQAFSDITINPDATFDVIETYRYSFNGDFSAVDRVIYLDRIEDITDIGVFEGSNPLRFDVSRSSSQVMVTWHFSAHSQEKTYTLKYRVHGGINFFSDVDAFYWKAMPADRDVPIGHVTVTIHFPAPIDTNNAEVALNTGSQNQRHYFADNSTLVFEGDNSPVGDDFEVGATMPRGMVAETFSAKRFISETVLPLIIPVIPILTLIAMLTLYFKFGRDLPATFSAYRITSPPDDLEPGLVGTLFDERADNRDVMATIYDLARRGYLEITETEGTGLVLFGSNREYTFTLKKDPADPGLKPFERKALEIVFSNKIVGTPVKVTDLQNDVGTTARIAAAMGEFYKETVGRGFFPENPNSTRGKYSGIGFAVILATVGAFFCGACSLLPGANTAFCLGGSVILSGLLVMAMSSYMPRRTQLGSDEKAKWAAFKRYLEELASFKSTPEGKELFDKYYPYAVVFGIESGIVSAFEKAGAQVPFWFIPYGVGLHTRPGIGTGGVGGVGGMGGMGSFKASMGSLQGATNSFFSALNTASHGGSHGGSFHGGGGFHGGGFHGGGGGGMHAR